MTKKISLKKVLVEAPDNSSKFTDRILKNIRQMNSRIVVEDIEREGGVRPEEGRLDITDLGKETMHLLPFKGKFLKPCPGTLNYICCGYQILNVGTNCPMDCSYCILQSYFNKPNLRIFTNLEREIDPVFQYIDNNPNTMFRIGTGELADSLALDPITGFSRRLVPFFAGLANGFLELKTKSDCIANLQGQDHKGHTIVSWSVNSRRICLTEEPGSPPLEERLAAALQCRKWGYKLGFHFDPIVFYEGWETEYREAVLKIFHTVDPAAVVWVSLGALRFPPHLLDYVKERFPQSKIPYGEFVPGHHGKLRYFRSIRQDIYRKMISWIREQAPEVAVYLCMESDIVWGRSFEMKFCGASAVSKQLDEAVVEK